jgi:hypothetical protein
MAAKRKEDEQEERVKIDDTDVKVKTPSLRKTRPVYYCQACDMSFPSQLDLEEHTKIDHGRRVAVS